MLYFIGLGLGDEKDITMKGYEAVKSCDKIFLEHYTSILGVDIDSLEKFFEKKLIVADRDLVESNAEMILDAAEKSNTAFLVVGDPFGATTHADLVMRAKERNIPVKVIHNASIMNAVGCTGLMLYRFGQTISIPFYTETWRPDSFYERIVQNHDCDLHTLCLLDIKVKEPDFQAMMRGRTVFLPPRYMTVNQAIEELFECEEKYKKGVCGPDNYGVGVARIGHDDQVIAYGKLSELVKFDFGAPLHSLILCASLHEVEQEMLDTFAAEKQH
ncbi:hypothetical protein WA158_003969 [Blastocystis sp. Blastoise]